MRKPGNAICEQHILRLFRGEAGGGGVVANHNNNDFIQRGGSVVQVQSSLRSSVNMYKHIYKHTIKFAESRNYTSLKDKATLNDSASTMEDLLK